MEDTSIQLHGHACGDVPLDRAWCFCFLVQSVSPTSGLHVHMRTERSRKTRQNDWKQAKRKAGRPNVLWAKIYMQRESTWEWLRSPLILLILLLSKSLRRPLSRGRGCRDLGRIRHRNPPNFNVKQAAGVNRGFAFTVSKTQGRSNYWKTSYWDVTAMSYWAQSNYTLTVD